MADGSTQQVAVVGNGLIGLTTVAELLAASEHGLDIEVTCLSPNEFPDTSEAVLRLRESGNTSAVATAIWHIYLVPKNDFRVLSWARVTLERLRDLLPVSGSGVFAAHGRELFRHPKEEDPSWRDIPGINYEELAVDVVDSVNRDFPEVSVAKERRQPVQWGYEIDTVVAQMDIYLPWLSGCAQSERELLDAPLESLDAVSGRYDVIVNCSGLGALELVPDLDVVPVRGQYLLVPTYEDTPATYIGDDDHSDGMAYAIPRGDGVCIGGTEEDGMTDLSFSLVEEDLINRVSDSAPWVRQHYERALREGKVERVVGLRPKRNGGVSLERGGLADGRPIVHNYGHGGSGFSLAWGCAREVVDLVKQVVSE